MSWPSANGREPGDGDLRRAQASVATIDQALESGRVTAMDPEDRALQELALALREQAPRPSEDFSRRLDDRVATGFPRSRDGRARRLAARFGLAGERRERRTSGRLVPRRPSMPALAGAASLLVALLVLGSVLTTSTPPDSPQTLQAPTEEEGAAVQPAPGTGASEPASPSAAPDPAQPEIVEGERRLELSQDQSTFAPAPVPPPPNADAGAGRENRQVERTAQIELAAPAEDLDRVGEGIASIADRRDGFLLSSSLSTGERGAAGGNFEMRVPVDELEASIAELSRLAEVRSLTQSGEDLTAQVVTTDRAAERARAQRAELEDRLDAANDADDQARLRQRIEALTFELRSARDQAKGLAQRVSFATISVTLVEGEGAQGTLGGALDDMVGLLEGALALALRILGVALPIGLVVALVVIAARTTRRRRRESALA